MSFNLTKAVDNEMKQKETDNLKEQELNKLKEENENLKDSQANLLNENKNLKQDLLSFNERMNNLSLTELEKKREENEKKKKELKDTELQLKKLQDSLKERSVIISNQQAELDKMKKDLVYKTQQQDKVINEEVEKRYKKQCDELQAIFDADEKELEQIYQEKTQKALEEIVEREKTLKRKDYTMKAKYTIKIIGGIVYGVMTSYVSVAFFIAALIFSNILVKYLLVVAYIMLIVTLVGYKILTIDE